MDKQAIIGGLFRIFATGGSGIRLVDWCRRKKGRKLGLDLVYNDEGPHWRLELNDADGSSKFADTSDSLEGIVVRAVVALGKEM